MKVKAGFDSDAPINSYGPIKEEPTDQEYVGIPALTMPEVEIEAALNRNCEPIDSPGPIKRKLKNKECIDTLAAVFPAAEMKIETDEPVDSSELIDSYKSIKEKLTDTDKECVITLAQRLMEVEVKIEADEPEYNSEPNDSCGPIDSCASIKEKLTNQECVGTLAPVLTAAEIKIEVALNSDELVHSSNPLNSSESIESHEPVKDKVSKEEGNLNMKEAELDQLKTRNCHLDTSGSHGKRPNLSSTSCRLRKKLMTSEERAAASKDSTSECEETRNSRLGTSGSHGKRPNLTSTERSRACRLRKKLINDVITSEERTASKASSSNNDIRNSADNRQTSTERVRAYRQRKRLIELEKMGVDPAVFLFQERNKRPMTSTERSRACRLRKRRQKLEYVNGNQGIADIYTPEVHFQVVENIETPEIVKLQPERQLSSYNQNDNHQLDATNQGGNSEELLQFILQQDPMSRKNVLT